MSLIPISLRRSALWCAFFALFLLHIPAKATAWGSSWIYLYGDSIDAGAQTEGDYWDFIEWGGGVGVDASLTRDGAYTDHRWDFEQYSTLAQVHFFSWAQVTGTYGVAAAHYSLERYFCDYCGFYWSLAGYSAATVYYQSPNNLPPGSEYIDQLSQQGFITGWAGDPYSGPVSLFLSPSEETLVIGVCLAQPEVCAVGGAVFTVAVFWPQLQQLINVLLSQRTSRDLAPVQYPSYNTGRDANGDCGPLDPTKIVKWRGGGDDHWHWIEWNRNPSNCQAYPRYRSGPNDPGPAYIEIPR